MQTSPPRSKYRSIFPLARLAIWSLCAAATILFSGFSLLVVFNKDTNAISMAAWSAWEGATLVGFYSVARACNFALREIEFMTYSKG